MRATRDSPRCVSLEHRLQIERIVVDDPHGGVVASSSTGGDEEAAAWACPCAPPVASPPVKSTYVSVPCIYGNRERTGGYSLHMYTGETSPCPPLVAFPPHSFAMAKSISMNVVKQLSILIF